MALRVFVVEDDALLQRVVRRGLRERGYLPVAARSGADLRVLLELGTPDLIVLDIELPDADGRDVLHFLAQNPATAAVPVVVWSGRNRLHDEVSALKLGARAYVAKADVSTLVAAVDCAFGCGNGIAERRSSPLAAAVRSGERVARPQRAPVVDA